jgi:hypothetical protein
MSGRNILKWTVTYEQQKIKLWAVNKYTSKKYIIWAVDNVYKLTKIFSVKMHILF